MLTGITLENFKAFKDPQFIPIKPITLVFGPNSAGKSSIIQALAFLKHVNDTEGNCDPMTVDYGGQSIYLGSWNNLVYGHDKSATMRISLHFESCCIRWSFGWREHGARIASFDFFNKAEPSNNDEPIARGSNTGSTYINWSVELHSKHPFWEKYKSLIWKSLSECYHAKQNINDEINSDSRAEKECQVDQNKLSRISIESLGSAFISAFEKWIMTGWRKIPDPCDGSHEYSGFLFPGLLRFFHGYVYPTINNPNFTIESMLERSSNSNQIWCEYRGDIAEEDRAKEFIARFISSCESANADTSLFDEMLHNVNMAEETILERSNVSKIFSGDYESPITRTQHVGAFRKVTNVLLWRNFSNNSKSGCWNKMFGNSMEFDDLTAGSLANPFSDFYGVNAMLKQIEIDYTIKNRIVKTVSFKPGEVNFEDLSNAEVVHSDKELVCVDKEGKTHSLLSVGSGVSVILPLIMALSQQSRREFLSIEEPESHIHPRLQANLADIILASTMGKVGAQTLIESHSEHLILRILRRIRETTAKDYSDWSDDLIKACPNGLRPEDVSVLYVEPAKAGEEGTKVIELPVTLDGDFSRPWPGGFFAERDKELF